MTENIPLLDKPKKRKKKSKVKSSKSSKTVSQIEVKLIEKFDSLIDKRFLCFLARLTCKLISGNYI